MNITPWTCQSCQSRNIHTPAQDNKSPVIEWSVAGTPPTPRGFGQKESVYVTCPRCLKGQMIEVES
ncbi:hypothetical protein [Dyella sp. C11]|uniref:hypothetical protein n=1 Tax=Dyella sp. C11 TaxID=2126991 RepID=UPI001300958B|nr:hypothetical protein [Dyella sp. C11]